MISQLNIITLVFIGSKPMQMKGLHSACIEYSHKHVKTHVQIKILQ